MVSAWTYLNCSIAASSDEHVMIAGRIVQAPGVPLHPVMQSRVAPQGDTVLLSCCHLRNDEEMRRLCFVFLHCFVFWGGGGREGGAGAQGTLMQLSGHVHDQ